MEKDFSTFDLPMEAASLPLRVRLGLAMADVWLASCRLVEINGDYCREMMRGGHPWVLALWHHSLIYALYRFRGVRCAIMVSASRDGELVANALRRWGQIPVRGSSNRHGVRALRQMARLMVKEGLPGGIVADGSQGPPFKAQPGAVFLAREAGCPIVPMGMEIRPCHRLNSWDRLMIPFPFSKVWIAYGDPIEVSKEMGREEFERAVKRLEAGLNSARGAAMAAAGQGG